MKEKHKKQQKKQKQKQKKPTNKQRQKIARGNRSYSERVRAKWFCRVFKLDFLQLICNASLIFKWNLELALSIILKQRGWYESKYVAVECRCLKTWDLFSFLIYSSILVLKWRQVLLMWIELQLAQVNICKYL